MLQNEDNPTDEFTSCGAVILPHFRFVNYYFWLWHVLRESFQRFNPHYTSSKIQNQKPERDGNKFYYITSGMLDTTCNFKLASIMKLMIIFNSRFLDIQINLSIEASDLKKSCKWGKNKVDRDNSQQGLLQYLI